jgi:hypothetical protein
MADTYERLHRYRILEQGDAALSFYRLRAEYEASADWLTRLAEGR